MTAFTLLGFISLVALLIFGLTALANLRFFLRLQGEDARVRSPLVSVLVPARNEAKSIGQTLDSLRVQNYPAFEVIVLDDQSEDETGAIVQRQSRADTRIRLLSGQALPAGWLGKNWACHQLSEAAQGDLLVFLDADVQCTPDALAAVVSLFQRESADLLTVWPTQKTVTWSERLTVPLMSLAVLAYLPILPVHHTSWPAFAAANGQCLAFRRAAYETIGGHAAVRNLVVEDVALARLVKRHGFRLRMADGNGQVSCRMYQNWREVRHGFGKNILAGHGNSVAFLALSTLFHWIVFVWPWLWLLLGGGWAAVALLAGGVALRGLTAWYTRQRVRDALLMPVSVLLMTVIAAQSIWWQWRGTGQWKGRLVTT